MYNFADFRSTVALFTKIYVKNCTVRENEKNNRFFLDLQIREFEKKIKYKDKYKYY